MTNDPRLEILTGAARAARWTEGMSFAEFEGRLRMALERNDNDDLRVLLAPPAKGEKA